MHIVIDALFNNCVCAAGCAIRACLSELVWQAGAGHKETARSKAGQGLTWPIARDS